MSDEPEHDAASSRRYKEDLDGVWPQMKALESRIAELDAREQRIRSEGFDQGYREAKMIHGGDQQAAVNRALEEVATHYDDLYNQCRDGKIFFESVAKDIRARIKGEGK